MRRAIVHIGWPRTGTTTLQRVLFDLRPRLEAAGILYPDLTPSSATEPHLSHQHLGEALDGRRSATERTELIGQLHAQLGATGADMVLLSYEGLCLLPALTGAPGLLRAVFDAHGFAMETLLTLKPQAEQLNSTYTWRTQFLREARSFNRFLRAERRARLLHYDALARPWQAASNRTHLVPVRDRRSDRPLVERVFTELGLLDQVAPLLTSRDTALVENRSPGPLAVEACRRLRAGGAHLALGPRIREATRFVEQAVRDGGLDTAPFRGLDQAARQRIEAEWAAANDRLAGRVWNAAWSTRVATEPPLPVSDLGGTQDAETERHVTALLDQACARFGITLRSRGGMALRDLAARPAALLRPVLRYGRTLLPR